MKRICAALLILLLIPVFLLPAANAAPESGLTVSAKAAVLMDQATGKVLFSQNEHQKLYPASVTKIMSLLLFMEALQSGKLDRNASVSASADAASKGGSQIWLKEGERMTVDELLRAVAVGSANDACTALAEAVSGSEEAFVAAMNERAKALGMADTRFENCTGLDDDTEAHKTSAYDVALMSRALLEHEEIRAYTTIWMDSLRDGKTELVNTNKLIRFYKGATGLKTGTTSKAGCCVSASAERNGLHLIAVVLGAENSSIRFEAAKQMLNWGFANFETVTPVYDEALLTDVQVLRGVLRTIRPVADPVPAQTLPKGKKEAVAVRAELASQVEAPVEKGQVLGKLIFHLDGETLCECMLRAEEGTARLTPGIVMQRLLRRLSKRPSAA